MKFKERCDLKCSRRDFLNGCRVALGAFVLPWGSMEVTEAYDFLPTHLVRHAVPPLPGKLTDQIGNRIYPNDGYQHLEKITLPTGRNDESHHIGTDFNIGKEDEDLGIPVATIMNGVCVYCDKSDTRDLGNIIIMCHQLPDSSLIYARYAHLATQFAKVGYAYKAGEVIAEVGKSGFERGFCHLHLDIANRELFEYRYRGRFADTRWYPRWAPVEFIERYYYDPVKLITEYQVNRDSFSIKRRCK